MRKGGFAFPKDHPYLGKESNKKGDYKLCIESPIWMFDDIGGNIRKISIILKLFKLALDVIKFNLLESNSFVLLLVPDLHKTCD